jgi:hypothetical protein
LCALGPTDTQYFKAYKTEDSGLPDDITECSTDEEQPKMRRKKGKERKKEKPDAEKG